MGHTCILYIYVHGIYIKHKTRASSLKHLAEYLSKLTLLINSVQAIFKSSLCTQHISMFIQSFHFHINQLKYMYKNIC